MEATRGQVLNLTDASAGTSSSAAHLVEQPDTAYQQSTEAMPAGQMFTATTVNAPQTPSTYDTTSYKEVMSRLDSLWTDKTEEIESLTEDHWKSQDFPLARIKKIMRMDEDVKMISTEVPVMFSKVLEIFITELTMRSWLHTEESKRRTVQRSDIAMAITKNDMFDFLIDIVPREEIQLKTKAQKEGGDSVQLLPPDMLQDYIQQVINQTFATMGSIEGEGGDESSSTVNTLQQLQLIQQLAQLQQVQQDQQQPSASVGQQLQHVVQTPSGSAGGHYDTTGGGGVDIQVLQSSTTASTNQQAVVQLDSTTVGSALDKIAENSSGRLHSHGDGDIGRGLHSGGGDGHTRDMAFGQQTLHHVNPPQGFHQQQQQQQPSIFNNQHPQITTVVIPQPMSPVQPPAAVSTASMALDSAGFQLHQTHDMSQEEGCLRDQLESLATEQFISHRVPVELSSPPSLQGREEGGEGPGSNEVMVTGDDRIGYQNIPEGESIPGPISPIRGMSSGAELAGVVFQPDKTY